MSVAETDPRFERHVWRNRQMEPFGFTSYASQALLAALVGITSPFGCLTQRPDFYVALSSTMPTDTGGNIREPAASTGYVRQPIVWGLQPDNGKGVENARPVIWPIALKPWGAPIVALVLFDAARGGHALASAPLPLIWDVQVNDEVVFPAGALRITLDGQDERDPC